MSTPTVGTVSQHVEFEREAALLSRKSKLAKTSFDNVFGGKFPWLLIFGWFFPAFYFNASVSYFGGYLLDAYGIWKQSIPTPTAHSEAEINGDALVTIFVSISTILAFFALWQCNIIRVPLDVVSVFGMIIVYSTSILLSSAIFSRRGDTATPAPFTVLAMYTSGTIALGFTFSVAVAIIWVYTMAIAVVLPFLQDGQLCSCLRPRQPHIAPAKHNHRRAWHNRRKAEPSRTSVTANIQRGFEQMARGIGQIVSYIILFFYHFIAMEAGQQLLSSDSPLLPPSQISTLRVVRISGISATLSMAAWLFLSPRARNNNWRFRKVVSVASPVVLWGPGLLSCTLDGLAFGGITSMYMVNIYLSGSLIVAPFAAIVSTPLLLHWVNGYREVFH